MNCNDNVDYLGFLNSKIDKVKYYGFDIDIENLNSNMFDWQKVLTQWALKKGRSAILADCGLGKTLMQLDFAQKSVEKLNKPALIFTPLAVAQQTVLEGRKFGIECFRSNNGKVNGDINVTNYEKIHHFDRDDFGCIVCDESSAIKHFQGARQKAVTEFMKGVRFRLLCSATIAPNDFIEIGTSSEALGEMGRMDMVGEYFYNNEKSLHPMWWGARWTFKPHAEEAFWRWVCSWARAIRKPSDLGYPDQEFILPKLIMNEHIIEASRSNFFSRPARTLNEQRAERKATLKQRCEKVADLISQREDASVMWCDYNNEADLLEKIIPNAKQIKGQKMKDGEKEELLIAFFTGELKKLVIKPQIGAFGLNWQHCNHMTFFPSHSFERTYQGIRRCWRFGQKREVFVDMVTTKGELGVLNNFRRKQRQADKMYQRLIDGMHNELFKQHIDKHQNNILQPSFI